MADTIEQSELRDVKTYEVGYLLSPLIPEDKVEETFNTVFGETVKSSGGALTAQLPPRMITLAYTITKNLSNKKARFSSAYFGAFRVEAAGDQIVNIKEAVEKSPEVVRFLVITLPKDADKLMVPRAIQPRRALVVKTEGGEEKKEMNEAEIDKEIEGLLEAVPK